MIRTSTKSPLADEGISRVAAVPTHRALPVVLFLFAAILIGRSIPQQSDWQWWFANYENWRGYMPFQGRCLMVPILHWAALSPMMIHLAVIFKQSCLGPDNLMLEFVDVLSILGTGAITIRLRKQFAPVSLFPWLAPFLVLWGVACTYAIRYESRFYMPYDLPALFFFSVGLLACVERRVLLFLAVLVVGTYNRETTIFLVPIWLCCNWREAKQEKLKLWATPLLGALIWLLVKLHIRHFTHGAASGLGITLNWRIMLLPHHWPQNASIAGFVIWPVLFFFSKLVRDRRLKLVWFGYIPIVFIALVCGWWNETRIFGELIPLVAVTAAIEFEQYIRDTFTPAGKYISSTHSQEALHG
ncbi:MAG TPA: hypothetical protein VGU46_08330 [Acidobacteriaceae bacterium]|nr:hypothetical protein [Acidobacteriaceae bacterium]